MKILVLHSDLGILRGGGENFTRNLFAAFACRGHHVAAAFVANSSNRYPLPLPDVIEAIPINGRWSNNLGQATLSSIGQYLPAESRYRNEWNRIQNALLWRVFQWHNRRFQRRIERELSARWGEFEALYVHGDTALASMVARHRPTILRLPGPVAPELEPILRSINAVCANGDALVQIRKFLGRHATELPIGIDTCLFKPGQSAVRRNLGWTARHRVIGYVGRLMQLKGVDLLAGAFREISRSLACARLLIIGSGPEEKYIRSTLAKELCQGIIHIESDVNHRGLADWYRAMDLLVMPSRYENFSNALLEGMACGVPFVASDVGGNKLLSKSGGGWLFEAGSESSLASCLPIILANKSELQNRGDKAYRYARNGFTWASSAQRLEEIITTRLHVAN